MCLGGMSTEVYRWRFVDYLVKKSMIIERQYLHHKIQFVSMNLYLVGMELVENESIMGF